MSLMAARSGGLLFHDIIPISVIRLLIQSDRG